MCFRIAEQQKRCGVAYDSQNLSYPKEAQNVGKEEERKNKYDTLDYYERSLDSTSRFRNDRFPRNDGAIERTANSVSTLVCPRGRNDSSFDSALGSTTGNSCTENHSSSSGSTFPCSFNSDSSASAGSSASFDEKALAAPTGNFTARSTPTYNSTTLFRSCSGSADASTCTGRTRYNGPCCAGCSTGSDRQPGSSNGFWCGLQL